MMFTRRDLALGGGVFTATALGGGGAAAQTRRPVMRHPPRGGGRNGRILSAVVNEAAGESFGDAANQAIGCGVRAVPVTLHWNELERRPGVFNPEPDWTAPANRFFPLLGLKVHLVITTIDTNNDRRPSWLRGRAFDHPECIASFVRLVDWLMPRLPDLDIVSISIGNEVDGVLANDPARWAAYSRFFAAGAHALRRHRPRTPIGAKMMWGGIIGGAVHGAGLSAAERFVDLQDRLMITYYPITPSFQMKPLEAVGPDLARLVERRRGKPIEIAEIGYSSDPGCGGSEAQQADFVSHVFRAWDAHREAIPLLCYFAWTDLPRATVDELLRYYGLPSPSFRAFLSGLGVRRADRSPKPALARLRQEARARALE